MPRRDNEHQYCQRCYASVSSWGNARNPHIHVLYCRSIHTLPISSKKEKPCHISFLCIGAPKAWYVIRSSKQSVLEDFVASHIIDNEYLNDHHGGVWQIIVMKSSLLNPALLKTFPRYIIVKWYGQHEGNFVIVVQKVYHGRFSIRYSGAQSRNFADKSCPEMSRVHSSKRNLSGP